MQYTPNYHLPLYEDNDVTSWLIGFNTLSGETDTAIHNVDLMATKNSTDITGLETQMSTANKEINELTSEVGEVSTKVSGHDSQIGGINNAISQQNNTIAAIQEQVEQVSTEVGKIYRGVLSTGETTIAITIDTFDDNSLVDVYTSDFGYNPETVELRAASGGNPNLCVLTFDTAPSADVKCAVVIR